MTYAVYMATKMKQGCACAICHRDFTLFKKGAESADHDHRTNEFRGVLCAKKTGCNFSLVARYEAGQTRNLTLAAMKAIRGYLANPPADRVELPL